MSTIIRAGETKQFFTVPAWTVTELKSNFNADAFLQYIGPASTVVERFNYSVGPHETVEIGPFVHPVKIAVTTYAGNVTVTEDAYAPGPDDAPIRPDALPGAEGETRGPWRLISA